MRPGDRVRSVLRHRRPRARDRAAAAASPRSTSPSGCSSAPAQDATIEWLQGDCSSCRSRTVVRRRDGSGSACRNVASHQSADGAPPRARRGRPGRGILEITRPQGPLAPFYGSVDRMIPAAGRLFKGGGAYTYLPAQRPRFPVRTSSRWPARAAGFRAVSYRLSAAASSHSTWGGSVTVATLASLRETPGPGRVPRRARGAPRAGGRRLPRVVSEVGARRSRRGGSGCGRCVFSARSPVPHRRSRRAVAVELVHMATLVHDDLIGQRRVSSGRAAAWSASAPRRRGPRAPTSSRGLGELADTGDRFSIGLLARATLCLARGEAMQRSHPATRRRPSRATWSGAH